MRLADRTGATCYPADASGRESAAEQRELLQHQRPYRVVAQHRRAGQGRVPRVSARSMPTPLLIDGFITEAEVRGSWSKPARSAEVAGSAFDPGRLIEERAAHPRLTAIPIERRHSDRSPLASPAAGPRRMRSRALRGRLCRA